MNQAVAAPRIFDGTMWHEDAALILRGGRVIEIVPRAALPRDAQIARMDGIVAPGFVDLQVNGGGGALLGKEPGLVEIETIIAAHARLGTTSLLPTLITADRDTTRAVLEAGAAAMRARLPGFLGLHLEGPHIDPLRKGAHDPRLIRPMDEEDMALLLAARKELPTLMVTLAPASVTPAQVARLAEARICVSLGHSDCDAQTARAYMDAGARAVTHLYNAMSPLGHRAPGLVGAALDDGRVSAGLIADGVHVDEIALRVAWRAKKGPGALFLVSDAMAVAGTDASSFTLDGREIQRRDGRLTLSDGTLAGADYDLSQGIRCLVRLGVPDGAALAAASAVPARVMELFPRKGALLPGSDADFVVLDEALELRACYRSGVPVT